MENAFSYLTRSILAVSKILPRGRWRIVQWLAQRDPAMQSALIKVPGTPELVRADLRVKTFIPYFLGYGSGNNKLRDFLPQILREGDVVYDIGANIGLVSLVLRPDQNRVITSAEKSLRRTAANNRAFALAYTPMVASD